MNEVSTAGSHLKALFCGGRNDMALSDQQRFLLHLIVRRYDHELKVAYLDPVSLEEETGLGLAQLAAEMDALEEQGYVDRADEQDSDDDGWAIVPTDKGVMTAMGLG
jgi:hypothetical protein